MELDVKSKDLQGKARKCLEGAKKVKKPDEQAKLKANASQLIGAAKQIEGQKKQLTAQQNDPWAAVPAVTQVVTQKLVSKVNAHLQENEFHCRIPTSASLVAHKPKSVKIKITDKDQKELLAHYFDPKNGLDDDGQTLTIPESILKTFRNQKLHLAVKETSFGMFEKDSFKIDIPLADLYRTNEISKSCKFDKVNFDVVIQIRQAISKKETEQVEEKSTTLSQIYQTFTQYEEEQNVAEPLAQEASRQVAQPATQAFVPYQEAPAAAPKPAPPLARRSTLERKKTLVRVAPTVPANVTAEEIKDVECDSMLRSVTYCESRIAEIKAYIDKCLKTETRIDAKQRAVLSACTKSKGMIEAGCGGGYITVQEYCDMLKELLEKDKALAAYFNKIKDVPANAQQLEICMARFKIVKKEYDELKEHL